MKGILRKNIDWPLVKRKPATSKPVTPPKRVVFPNDIIRRAPPLDQAAILAERAKIKFKASALAPVISGFLVLSLLVHAGSLLVKAKDTSGIVLGEATSAYADLDAANKSLEQQDFNTAKQKFTSAQTSLLNAQGELDKIRAVTLVAPPARSADNVLTGAYFLAEAGRNLAFAMQLFDELSVNSQGISTENYIGKLQENKELLSNSLTLIHYAQESFNSATGLPDSYQATLDAARGQVKTLKAVLQDFVDLEDLFLSYFGAAPKTYLLAFQNNDEIRATGGFIGTYGVLKYENGAIKKLQIQSVYDLDGSLTKQIAAPGPFQPDIQKWGMRDSNWFADFPTTARKLLEFFEYGSETGDGVIAVTPYVFKELLKLTGPIDMPAYGVILTPENFQQIVQFETSYNYDRILNQPKKFLDDFAPVLLDRLSGLKKEEWFTIFQIFKDSFLQKHVLVYSKDPDTQAKIAKLGFDGRILDTDRDYLAVINSNHGGTKTDLDIRQKVNYSSEIRQDGSIINTVTISRDNTSSERNLNFMRVLVPFGSKLLESSGFLQKEQLPSKGANFTSDPMLSEWDKGRLLGNVMVRTESGKTEFSGWTQTLGAESTEFMLKYELPYGMRIEPSFLRRTASHSLLLQKQSGSVQSEFTGEWIADGYGVEWSTQDLDKQSNKVKFQSDGKADEYWGIVLTK
jgi:hypothetical protein